MENKKRKHGSHENSKNIKNPKCNDTLKKCVNQLSQVVQELDKNKVSKGNECNFRNNERNCDNERDSVSEIVADRECKEIRELHEWIVNKNIPHEHANDLLKILRQRLLPNLPKTAENLLKCPSDQLNIQNTEVMSGGSAERVEIGKSESTDTEPFLQINVNNTIFNPTDRDTSDENVFNPLDIPIIEIQNNECKSDFQTNVMLQLSEINRNISFLRQRQEDMMNFLVDKKVIPTVDTPTMIIDFYKRYKFKLPLETMENFMQFDEHLKTDSFLLNDVCAELRRLVDKDYSISKSYVQMLKKFLSKDLALQFTTVRKSRSNDKEFKKLFKPTELCKCMDAALTYKRSETALLTTDSMLVTGLSDVLCNVKNWNKFKTI